MLRYIPIQTTLFTIMAITDRDRFGPFPSRRHRCRLKETGLW